MKVMKEFYESNESGDFHKSFHNTSFNNKYLRRMKAVKVDFFISSPALIYEFTPK